jgi:hypothetical protein
MIGARVVAIANMQSAPAADSVVNQEFTVERASEGPRRWWQRLFALGGGNNRPAVVNSAEAVAAAANRVELRPRPVVRLDPARGVID